MNKFYILFLSCFLPFFLFGQKKKKEDFVFREVKEIVVDGRLNEWEGGLYNPESTLWSFAVSKKGDRLYIAIRIQDDMLQREALRNGVFVNLSYNEKKKDGARLVYPFVDRERLRALSQEEDHNVADLKKDLLGSVQGYRISGFSKVVDGLLSFDNAYGIRAIARFDDADVLLYEAEVPLDLIKFTANKIAVQIGVNTQFLQMKKMVNSAVRPANVRIYGASPAGPALKNPYKEETAVWVFGSIK